MTDPQEYRLAELRKEVGQFASVAAFARHFQLDVTYVRQLLNGHRSFGEKAAQKMGRAIASDPNHFFFRLTDPAPQQGQGLKVEEPTIEYMPRHGKKPRPLLTELLVIADQLDNTGLTRLIERAHVLVEQRQASAKQA